MTAMWGFLFGLTAWCVVSVPFGVLVGKWLKRRSGGG